ncbi:MAG: cysteine--tRNA ligase [Patescibacteria group bacterium]
MLIQFFNSLGRKKEVFESLEKNRVKIYSCGPTVYASPHIGNFRAFIFADLLRRSLEFLGFEVESVMNITDVGHLVSDSDSGEDKLEKGAAREGISPLAIARKYEKEFLDDLEKLNIEKPTYLPRASEHIGEQIELIKTLGKKGFTYETSDGIYFDTSKFANYGALSGQKIEDKEAGARVAVKSEKRNPADFALWKFCVGENEKHILCWNFESGKQLSDKNLRSEAETRKAKIGFPGWHIECSAMSMKYLGASFDIHTGGVDHIPVHHENEIAQSEAATGQKFVNFWLHNEFLTIDGGKMSKSLGNLFTLADLAAKDFEPLAFRYFCLNSNYRGKLNFSWEALQNAQNSLEKLRSAFQKLPSTGAIDQFELEKFGVALADDLNSPRALAVVWDYLKKPDANQATLAKFDEVLGFDLAREEDASVELSAEQQKLLTERATARAEKDFAKSDEIRAKFAEMGLEIEDAKSGEQIVRKKN